MSVCALVAVASCHEDGRCEVLAPPPCPTCESGAVQWSQMYLGGQRIGARGVVVDACGSAFVAGHISPIASGGHERAFIAKYAPGGELAWTSISERDVAEHWYTIATDGHTIVVGGERALHGFAVDGDSTAVLAAYSTNGELEWERTFGAAPHARISHAAFIDGGERIVVASVVGESSLRILDSDGQQRRKWTQAVRALASSPDGGFVVTDDASLTRYDAQGDELARESAERVREVAIGPGGRAFAIDEEWGARVRELPTPSDAEADRDDPDHARVHMAGIAVADDHYVVVGHDTPDDRRQAWVERRTLDGEVDWTWAPSTTGSREIEAVAIGPDGSIVVAATEHAGIGWSDVDLWIGALAP